MLGTNWDHDWANGFLGTENGMFFPFLSAMKTTKIKRQQTKKSTNKLTMKLPNDKCNQ